MINFFCQWGFSIRFLSPLVIWTCFVTCVSPSSFSFKPFSIAKFCIHMLHWKLSTPILLIVPNTIGGAQPYCITNLPLNFIWHISGITLFHWVSRIHEYRIAMTYFKNTAYKFRHLQDYGFVQIYQFWRLGISDFCYNCTYRLLSLLMEMKEFKCLRFFLALLSTHSAYVTGIFLIHYLYLILTFGLFPLFWILTVIYQFGMSQFSTNFCQKLE